jgi:hypothetical protein
MKVSNLIAAFALSLAITACAGGIGNLTDDVDGAYALYRGYCLTNPTADHCSNADILKAADAKKVAEKAIAAWESSQKDVDYQKALKAVQAAIKLFEDFQN